MFWKTQPLNRHLEDAGFESVHGRRPNRWDSEKVRIETHLDHVIGVLRRADVSHLSTAQICRRLHCLDLLGAYRAEGAFPRNDYTSGRTPVFIDRDARICAVGHLIAQTAGLDVAERIAASHRLSYIEEIDLPVVDEWADRHGFTRRELAMIQPSYGSMVGDYTAQLTWFDWVVVLGVMPSLSVVSIWLRSQLESRKIQWLVGLSTGLWGGLMVATNLHALSEFWGKGWVTSTQWAVLLVSFVPAAAFLYISRTELRSASTWQTRHRARQILCGIVCASTIVFIGSVTPFSTEPCPQDPDQWTYDTNYGYWRMLVTPRSPVPPVRPKWGNEKPAIGIGKARACEGVYESSIPDDITF